MQSWECNLGQTIFRGSISSYKSYETIIMIFRGPFALILGTYFVSTLTRWPSCSHVCAAGSPSAFPCLGKGWQQAAASFAGTTDILSSQREIICRYHRYPEFTERNHLQVPQISWVHREKSFAGTTDILSSQREFICRYHRYPEFTERNHLQVPQISWVHREKSFAGTTYPEFTERNHLQVPQISWVHREKSFAGTTDILSSQREIICRYHRYPEFTKRKSFAGTTDILSSQREIYFLDAVHHDKMGICTYRVVHKNLDCSSEADKKSQTLGLPKPSRASLRRTGLMQEHFRIQF